MRLPRGGTGGRLLANRLLAQYEADLGKIQAELDPHNLAAMTQLASWPEQVRGYGHVRAANAQQALRAREAALPVGV